MKFIVSSKNLFEIIKLAIQFKAKRITVSGNSLLFSALREISLDVHFIIHPYDNYVLSFNQFRWQKVLNFLLDLPEQPITINLHEDRIFIACEALFVV